jgi:hypothetical protein
MFDLVSEVALWLSQSSKKSAKNGVAGVRSTPATPFFASFLDFEKALEVAPHSLDKLEQ